MFAYSEIINLLFSKQDYLLHVREIARTLHQNVAKTSELLNELIAMGVIKYERSGRSKIMALNVNDPLLSSIILLGETYKKIIFMQKNDTIEEFIRQTEKLNRVRILSIFGSYARGDPTKESDLDILMVTEKGYRGELPSYILPIKIHKIQMDLDIFLDAVEKNEPLLKEVVKNHILIKGADLFIETAIEKYGK